MRATGGSSRRRSLAGSYWAIVLYITGCWMFGLAWIGVLNGLGWSDRGWAVALRRGVFVAGIAVMLGVTTVVIAATNGVDNVNPSRVGVWFYCLGCAVPVTTLAFATGRRAFARTGLSVLGTLAALGVLASSGAAFREYGKPVDGFAATAHHHHVLVVAALLVPLVVLLAACRPTRIHPEAEPPAAL